jgi:hypothetical protein
VQSEDDHEELLASANAALSKSILYFSSSRLYPRFRRSLDDVSACFQGLLMQVHSGGWLNLSSVF